MTTATADTELQLRSQTDPVFFFEHFLGCGLFDKQRELVRSVLVNSRTAVCGANGTGKDYATGRLILWWLNCFKPSKVVLTGPTYRQVAQIVWRETRDAYEARKGPLGGRMLPEAPRLEMGEQWYGVGFSTNDPNFLSGFHSENLLIIVTEAHGMVSILTRP